VEFAVCPFGYARSALDDWLRSRRSLSLDDRPYSALLSFKIGPMNGSEAREGGLRLKTWVASRGSRSVTGAHVRSSASIGVAAANDSRGLRRDVESTVFFLSSAKARRCPAAATMSHQARLRRLGLTFALSADLPGAKAATKSHRRTSRWRGHRAPSGCALWR
jgi:hypothetical protein